MITRTRMVVADEVKMIKIYCPDWTLYSQGFLPEEIKGHVFIDEVFDEAKDYNEIFEKAKIEREENWCEAWAYAKDVEMKIYWKKI